MNYAKQANRPSPAAMLGALGVPAAFGAVLIAGLAVSVVITQPAPNPTGVLVTPKPIDPPPPPEPKPAPDASTNTAQTAQNPRITAPDTPFDGFETGPITAFPDFGDDIIGPVGPVDLGIDPPAPSPAPLADPIKASPRGNPGAWVTDNDYRTSWIRRGYSGRASFTLEISATGRVSDCTITRSTGHTALDDATCKHLMSRGRFTPAKDSSGNAVAGSYSSAINWELP